MSRRPSMLMISPAAPWPATTGGLVRIAGILNQMARHFDLTFVSPRRPDQHVPHGSPARFVCPALPEKGLAARALALMDPWRPFHMALYFRPEIERVIREELAGRRYDVVYSHFFYGMAYLEQCDVPVVIDQQNVDRVYWRNKAEHSAFPLNAYARWNTNRTIAYEDRVLKRAWAYVSVSEEDRRRTREYASPAVTHFWVAPNGVDTRRMAPSVDPHDRGDVVTLGYLGSMDLQMNVEAVTRFCETMLPRIRRAVPEIEIRFVVIGRNPAPRIRRIAAQTPGISCSGTVDDVVPWLQQLDVLVSPLRIGAGTKLKVAEALACGLPVVGSSLAFAGLAGESGTHYLRADDDDTFVSDVCRLARTPEERNRVGRNARQFAVAHLDWDIVGDRVAASIKDALARG